MLKLNFHFDRLKLSSKTVRKFLFNESYCFNDEKSPDEILFPRDIQFVFHASLLLHIKSHVQSARYNQLIKDVYYQDYQMSKKAVSMII